MATYQHPASLNPWQQFSQACAVLKNTSRASNPAWYQEALDLNLQLHIRTDGACITTLYHDRKKASWTAGPSLNTEILHDPAKLESYVAETLRYARSNGANSLGVILHIADEFATTELKPELDNPAALSELRETVVQDPGSILEDSTIQTDQASWRVMPYPAAGSEVIGTVIAISRQYAPFFEALRTAGEAANFPVITHALSSPLVSLMGLGQTITPTPGKRFVAILQYPWFITLAFFNERADLRFIRTLQHRGLRRPTNFRNALATTNASLEFVDPDLFLVPLGSAVDTTLAADLRITFTTSRVEVVEPVQHETLPGWCPEPLLSCQLMEPGTPLIDSHTFTALREEKWVLQNFLPTPQDIVQIYPDRTEMKMLRMLRMGRVALFAITVLCITYLAFGIVGTMRLPEWGFNPLQAEAAQGRLKKLTIERQKADHWNNLLEDRSKAWVIMESFSRMFPENAGMLVKTYTHSTKPDSTPGQAKVGFIKEWRITGFARDEAIEYLTTISQREGISAHFNEIARITGNSSFSPAIANRNLVVNVRTQENGSYKSVPPEDTEDTNESSYPFSFDLTITQRFEATDPMALTVSKAP